MKKKSPAYFLVLLLMIVWLSSPFSTWAVNRFGIHVLEPTDLPRAQELVNSNGGDWGWVTVVIRDDDLNRDKWQGFMDECRERHLIPLVRLATHLEGTSWRSPRGEEAPAWVDFLESLNWPVKERFVILFNEPNHDKEWGGQVDPEAYASVWESFYQELKEADENFQVLNAGLDLAAPNSAETMKAELFLTRMLAAKPEILDHLDGWVSHSYPNHGFLGKPWETGPISIQGYVWELDWLEKKFDLERQLPVFITETGWPKNQKDYYDEEEVADFLKEAFEDVWLKDERIKAITPFVLNYPGPLFADFSWLDEQGFPYPQFEKIKKMAKLSWWPTQEKKTEVVSVFLPPFLVSGTEFKGKMVLKNTGQSIWTDRGEEIWLSQAGSNLAASDLKITAGQKKVRPKEVVEVEFTLTPKAAGEPEFSWENLPSYQIKVLPDTFLSKAKFGFWEKVTLSLQNWLKNL